MNMFHVVASALNVKNYLTIQLCCDLAMKNDRAQLKKTKTQSNGEETCRAKGESERRRRER